MGPVVADVDLSIFTIPRFTVIVAFLDTLDSVVEVNLKQNIGFEKV